MVIINETSQNYFPNNTKKSKLNPQAPQFLPSTITNFTTSYPYLSPPPIKVFYPPQHAVINIIYRHVTFNNVNPTKTMYYGNNNNINNNEVPMLPIVESKPKSVSTRYRVDKPRKPGRPGSVRCFWVKKDVIESYPFGDSTTLMIRNIPMRYSRKELIELLDDHCRAENERISSSDDENASAFDFVYLPVDFKRKGNLGYAFVNMTTWQGASRLYNSWNGYKWENCPYNTKKICQINLAKFQGKRELRRHFEQSVFWCETNEYLPVEFSPPRNGINANETYITTIGTRVW